MLISNCPGAGFGDPGGDFGGPGGSFRIGKRSGKPLLLPVLKQPPDLTDHHQDHQNHHRDN